MTLKFGSLKFGTSGLRGLVSEITREECQAYAFAFLEMLKNKRTTENLSFSKIALAGDLRASTPEILEFLAEAFLAEGLELDFIGFIPTPALALYAAHYQIPGIMVTGSHIPEDRNGIKFYLPSGEILKKEEELITKYRQSYSQPPESQGPFSGKAKFDITQVNQQGKQLYIKRYKDFFGNFSLEGLRIGVYEHSAVGRDILISILTDLGAQVVRFDRSEHFIPVDTEAVENVAKLSSWVRQNALTALVSTDGDSDRPLLVDDEGKVWSGDILGLVVAKILQAQVVITPISSTSGIELSGFFQTVERTKIGSPFVIETMNRYKDQANGSPLTVVGFEANGGFLLGSNSVGLSPLLTRDALLPILVVLREIKNQKQPLSKIKLQLPSRFSKSGLLRGIDGIQAEKILLKIKENLTEICLKNPEELGSLNKTNSLDGFKVTLTNNRSLHFRPSGNAPEFRIYAEAESEQNVAKIYEIGNSVVHSLANTP